MITWDLDSGISKSWIRGSNFGFSGVARTGFRNSGIFRAGDGININSDFQKKSLDGTRVTHVESSFCPLKFHKKRRGREQEGESDDRELEGNTRQTELSLIS